MSDETTLVQGSKTGSAICRGAVKADTGDSGQYSSIVSVFGNIDYVGDVVVAGAYADDLAAWKASDDQLPVIWAHQWGDPENHIGVVLDAKELEPGHADLPEELKAYGGLWTLNQLDMDDRKAAKVFRLLKGRRITQFSFHYDVLEAAYGKQEDQTVRFLKKLHLNETGPCLLGANSMTTLLGTKTPDGFTAEEIAAIRAILTKTNGTTATPIEPPPAKDGHAIEPRTAGDVELRLALALADLS